MQRFTGSTTTVLDTTDDQRSSMGDNYRGHVGKIMRIVPLSVPNGGGLTQPSPPSVIEAGGDGSGNGTLRQAPELGLVPSTSKATSTSPVGTHKATPQGEELRVLISETRPSCGAEFSSVSAQDSPAGTVWTITPVSAVSRGDSERASPRTRTRKSALRGGQQPSLPSHIRRPTWDGDAADPEVSSTLAARTKQRHDRDGSSPKSATATTATLPGPEERVPIHARHTSEPVCNYEPSLATEETRREEGPEDWYTQPQSLDAEGNKRRTLAHHANCRINNQNESPTGTQAGASQ